MAFEYFCTKCYEAFLPGRFIEGTLHCPFCGTHYDITVLKHNNIEKHNQEQLTKQGEYITNHVSAIIIGTLVIMSLLLLSMPAWIEQLKVRADLIALSLILFVILELIVVGLICKCRAKKLFPPTEED